MDEATSAGLNWTVHDAATQSNWRSIAYGNGLFVAVGNSSRIMTSRDGVDWTTSSLPDSPHSLSFSDISYGGGYFIAVSGSYLASSTDGENWTVRPHIGMYITYGNGQFTTISSVLVGLSYANQSSTSSSGEDWASGSISVSQHVGIAYGNGTFAVVTSDWSSRKAAVSSDGRNWTSHTHVSGRNYWNDITYGNGNFVAIGKMHSAPLDQNGIIMTSPDGKDWTTRRTGLPLSQTVAYGNGRFVAVGPQAFLTSELNGVTWNQSTPPAASSWTAVAYGKGCFVAVAGSGDQRVARSCE